MMPYIHVKQLPSTKQHLKKVSVVPIVSVAEHTYHIHVLIRWYTLVNLLVFASVKEKRQFFHPDCF